MGNRHYEDRPIRVTMHLVMPSGVYYPQVVQDEVNGLFDALAKFVHPSDEKNLDGWREDALLRAYLTRLMDGLGAEVSSVVVDAAEPA